MNISEQDMTTPESREAYYKACWLKAAEKVAALNILLKQYMMDHKAVYYQGEVCECSLCKSAVKEIFE